MVLGTGATAIRRAHEGRDLGVHELSIATALRELALQHCPADHTVAKLIVQVGPLQAIESDSMQWAWQAVCAETDFAQAELVLHTLPWILRCLRCDREWPVDDVNERCSCGESQTTIVGGDELTLISLEVSARGQVTEEIDENSSR